MILLFFSLILNVLTVMDSVCLPDKVRHEKLMLSSTDRHRQCLLALFRPAIVHLMADRHLNMLKDNTLVGNIVKCPRDLLNPIWLLIIGFTFRRFVRTLSISATVWFNKDPKTLVTPCKVSL